MYTQQNPPQLDHKLNILKFSSHYVRSKKNKQTLGLFSIFQHASSTVSL